MQKKYYLKELSISDTQQLNGGNNKPDVSKIQSWLTLYSLTHPEAATATAIDGKYGPATMQAVKNFQKVEGIPQTGIVTIEVFSRLCSPMKNAFETQADGSELRQLIVNTAIGHARYRPFELTINGQSNMGPWVRAYMDGYEGEKWYWCMGFAQAILDQAATQLGKNFQTLMPLTYSCDTVGMTGIHKGLLTRNSDLRRKPDLAKPGDFFLVQKSPFDWVHTGIITAIKGDVFETVEGNTNSGGSSNGVAVLNRVRNFQTSKLDVFSIEPLV